jgi:cytochrome b561
VVHFGPVCKLVWCEPVQARVWAVLIVVVPSSFDMQLASLHYYFGIAILALVGIRLIARIARVVPSAHPDTPYWTDMAARLAHGLFDVLLVGLPVTRLLGYYVEGPYADIHAWAKPVFIGLSAIHAIAALYHQFPKQDGALACMLKPNS